MKTQRIFIIALLLFQLFCKEQYGQLNIRPQTSHQIYSFESIVDTAKLWSVYLQYANNQYSKYYKIGDTITLNGNIYYKVYETNDSLLLNWNLSNYIRENENSEVFLRTTSGDEGMIYKFDLNPNDTVVVYNPLVCPVNKTLIVSSTDSILLGNEYKKRIFFFNSDNEDYWTEGIGSRFGLLFSNYCYIGVLYNLICFYKSDTLIYLNPDFDSCYYPLIDNIDNSGPIDKFYIWFNPNDQSLIINNLSSKSKALPYILKVFNILGNEIYSSRIQSYPRLIQTEQFVKGIYLVNIYLQGNLVFQSKVPIY
jgi:hypothetical protein